MKRPKIVYRKEIQAVGLQAMVKPGAGTIKELWAAFNKRRLEIACPSSIEASLGICEYYPNITDESDFSYIACIEVAHSDQVPFGMIKRTIPSSKYAVFTHCNFNDHIKDIYQYIYGVWLPQSGYEVAELDTIERYEFKMGHSTNGLDIYIPIK